MSYAGDITPLEAWKMLSDNPRAVLVDVRTDAEWRFVGVPDLSSLGREVVFLCRSGNRSIGAAEVATEVGITPAYNVLDGFEGHLNGQGHRGETGWRAIGLPWKQL